MLLRHFLFLTFVATCFALPQTVSPRQANISTDAAPGTVSEEASPSDDTNNGVNSAPSPINEDEQEQNDTNTTPASPKTPTAGSQAPATVEPADGEDEEPGTSAPAPEVTNHPGNGGESATSQQLETGSSTNEHSEATPATETPAGGSGQPAETAVNPVTTPAASITNSTHTPAPSTFPGSPFNTTGPSAGTEPSGPEDSEDDCALPCGGERSGSYTNATTGTYCSACRYVDYGEKRNVWDQASAICRGDSAPAWDVESGDSPPALCLEAEGDEPTSFACYDACNPILRFSQYSSRCSEHALYELSEKCSKCEKGHSPGRLNPSRLAQYMADLREYCSAQQCLDIVTNLRTVNGNCPVRDDEGDCTLTCESHSERYTNTTTEGYCADCRPDENGKMQRNAWDPHCVIGESGQGKQNSEDEKPELCLNNGGLPPSSFTCYDTCNALLQLSKAADPCTTNTRATIDACMTCERGQPPRGILYEDIVVAYGKDLTSWCLEKHCFDIGTSQRSSGPNCPALPPNSSNPSTGGTNPAGSNSGTSKGNGTPSAGGTTTTPSTGGDSAQAGSIGGDGGATGGDSSKSGSSDDKGVAAAPAGTAPSAGAIRGSTVISAGRAVATVINDQNGVALSQVIAVSTTDGSGRPTLELFTQALVGGTFTPNTRIGSSPPTATSSPSGSLAAVRLNHAIGTFSLALSLLVLRLV